MRLIALLLLALATPALAQAPADPMRPTPARWDIQVLDGNRYLRATSDNGDGPGKLMFLCNQTGELVLMAMAMGAGDEVANATGSVGIVLDGAVEPAAEQPRPIVMNQSLVSLLAMDPARFRRLMAAQAAGVVWNGHDGARLVGFQVRLGDGRSHLASFARECSAQNYP